MTRAKLSRSSLETCCAASFARSQQQQQPAEFVLPASFQRTDMGRHLLRMQVEKWKTARDNLWTQVDCIQSGCEVKTGCVERKMPSDARHCVHIKRRYMDAPVCAECVQVWKMSCEAWNDLWRPGAQVQCWWSYNLCGFTTNVYGK
jgi:hypothetical protein